jgi:hypothetical protein
MGDEFVYTCSVCGKQAAVKKGDTVPLCCRKEMGPLPYCTEAPNPEMARNYNEDGACDDGTMPKK